MHEVWPGHFLQFLHANRNPSKIGALWVGYAFAEGWAHYAEEMMWEAGLGNGDPETHIGQLTNALLRDVRYLSAIGLHTEGMTVEESEQMFREQALPGSGQCPPAGRARHVRSGVSQLHARQADDPQAARGLAGQAVAGRGPRAHWQEFHDEFLSYGGPPIPLVRKEMLGEGGSLF